MVGCRVSGGCEERTGDAASLHAAWPEVRARTGRRAVAVCRVTGPAVVLGSTQSEDVVDRRRAAAAGVAVARRRSGGGAVLVTPEDPAWIDVWVPAGDPLWRDDVGRAFDWLGDTGWRRSAAWGSPGSRPTAGVRAVHPVVDAGLLRGGGDRRGGDRRRPQGGRPGPAAEPRRAWFHGACYLRWDPAPLVGLLALSPAERAAAADGLRGAVAGVAELVPTGRDPGRRATTLASSLVAALP